jgi:hypothetical protein
LKVKGTDKFNDFLLGAVNEHKASAEYRIAKDAEMYDRGRNVTIEKYQKYLFKMTGEKIPDVISPNYKLKSGYFKRFTTQLVQFLLGNGVTFSDEKIKKKLGEKFDTDLQHAGKYALIGGVSYGFWDLDKLRIFKTTEFKPLKDEENGSIRVGIRFWQLAPEKPLRLTLYEDDGYTEYIKYDKEPLQEMENGAKRPYKLLVKSTQADGTEIYGGENYPNFPIVPLYANEYGDSELVGLRASIDAYDLIKSGFANDLDGHLLYWLVNNANGMDDVDLARLVERLKMLGVAVSDDEATITPKEINIPYESRIAYLNKLDEDMYRDFGAVKIESLSTGNMTASQIETAYFPLEMKANDFEYQCIEFVQNILKLQGVDTTPQFKRDKISNYAETTSMILQSGTYLDQETVLKKLPFLTPDEVQNILKKTQEEEARRYKVVKQISQGKGFKEYEIDVEGADENEDRGEQEKDKSETDEGSPPKRRQNAIRNGSGTN